MMQRFPKLTSSVVTSLRRFTRLAIALGSLQIVSVALHSVAVGQQASSMPIYSVPHSQHAPAVSSYQQAAPNIQPVGSAQSGQCTNCNSTAGTPAGIFGNNNDLCGYSAHNPPAQPQAPIGRCQPCSVAVDCADGAQTWADLHRYNFQPLAHGEYRGPVRLPAAINNRIRVGDELQFTYILSRNGLNGNYRLQPGDQLQVTLVDDAVPRQGSIEQNRGPEILSDGMLYLEQIGGIRAAGLTIEQLTASLEEAYEGLIKIPGVSVVPIQANTALEDLRDSVDDRSGLRGGQNFVDTVHADGTVRLPRLGAVCVLGMTLDEIKREVNLRYQQIVSGLEVEPVLAREATHVIYVYGEVANPNRYTMDRPTTITQALAMAGSITPDGNAREVVIFRRAEDWRLIATRLDIKGVHLGKNPLPSDEIWLRDNDLIIVPPKPIARFDRFVDQWFTQGIYSIFPFAQIGEGFNANGFAN